MSQIVVPMRPNWSGIHDPRIVVTLRQGTAVTAGIEALVDTGSPWTLAHESIASKLNISRGADALTISLSVGGTVVRFWRSLLDLQVGSDAALTLPGAAVFFGPLHLPQRAVDVLLGQHEVLERLVLVHLNQAPKRRFILREP